MLQRRAIEESFPIVEINRLAVPERNAFKPIYQMHKWFARRASCVFRAILLGCLKPAGTDIMEEFYKDHTNDPDTVGKVILDPFMGGGTTVVEALRLGCKVIGIDLNPVAWFIVKTEVEPVDIDALKEAFERLAHRKVAWSGKSVKETLLEQYKTECPCCGAGREKADIIYTFWVKSAICTNPLCKKEVPLFSDSLIAQKSPSIRYFRDTECPKCHKRFDWEVEPAALIAEPSLMVSSPAYSAGIGRATARWAYSVGEMVRCPWCREEVRARPAKSKLERKKVPLSVLLCPSCYTVWQWRGEVPDTVTCPVCHTSYNPHRGNVPEKGKFVCPACGTKDAIIASIRKLPEDQLLPMHPYAIEGYCPACGGDSDDEDEDEGGEVDFFERRPWAKRTQKRRTLDHPCHLTRNNGKFFKRVTAADLARYQAACTRWEREKDNLPYPKSEIPEGFNTNQMIKHHYRYWHQMFNPRQLLCIATLLQAIDEEPDQTLKEILLSGFGCQLLRNQNLFCFYNPAGSKLEPLFSRHDFAPVNTSLENNVWGLGHGRGTWVSIIDKILEGKRFATAPYDTRAEAKSGITRDPLKDGAEVDAYSTVALKVPDRSVDWVITDPPYADNVNYSELSDFFYVWLRLLLASKYQAFAPEYTPKAEEIVVNPTRGKSEEEFEELLTRAFLECNRVLRDTGLMAFTFRHSSGKTWDAVLSALCRSGFEILGIYPIHGDEEKGGAMGAMKITYDLIHVCRKRPPDATVEKRSWAGIRQEIRRRAREEIRAIEAGRYGNEPLSPADVNLILIGKCLELYSRHYGAVVDHEGNPFELKDALKEIRNLVDQLVTRDRPLPAELEDIDAESRIYLLTLCDRKEIKSDEVHKATRGILEPEDLIEAGLMVRGRAGRGRTYEVKQPSERFQQLLEQFTRGTPAAQTTLFPSEPPKRRGRILFIDYIHLLMALAEGGENLLPWLERFRGEAPRIRAACEYLASRNKAFAPTLKRILSLLDVGPLFR